MKSAHRLFYLNIADGHGNIASASIDFFFFNC